MTAVLREVGGYPAANVVTALRPDRAGLLAAIASLRERVQRHTARGEQAQLLFYYSGHARADAITLGREEVPLGELREQILGLPSTLTIVVIDACQSGAFSRIKGAEATTDFSYNSVARLGTAGLAVMASSSATELSQESDQLESSYFTHHLLLALRGAGDANQDGRVSLDEAYRYTYNRTLAGTAATAVGAQHATLETALKGKGDVVLTQPAAASSQLFVPGAVEGRLLIQHRASGSVLAELDKARGSPVRLAMASGAYTVLLRQGDEVRECDVTLPAQSTVSFNVATCRPARLDTGAAKGAVGPPWAVELAAGRDGGAARRVRARDASVRFRRVRRQRLAGTVSPALGDRGARAGAAPGADADLAGAGRAGPHARRRQRRRRRPLRLVDLRPGRRPARHAAPAAGPPDPLRPGHRRAGRRLLELDGRRRHHPSELLRLPRRCPGGRGGHAATVAGVPGAGRDYYAPVMDNRFGQTHDSGGLAFQLGARYAF